MNKVLATAILFPLLAGLAAAQTPLDSVAAQVRAQAAVFPADLPLVVLTPADKDAPRQTYTVHRTANADGTLTVAWKSLRIDSLQTFRADGTLVHSRQADFAKGLVLEETVAADRSSVRTVLTDKTGAVKSDKKADLKAGMALRDELQNLVVQAWKAGVRDGLKFQSLSPDGGMPGDFVILFKTTTDPTALSDKYTYPAEFRSALGTKRDYLVADMALQGIGAFFYPHHFYLVFTAAPAPEFIAYFGEDPKNPTFQFVAK